MKSMVVMLRKSWRFLSDGLCGFSLKKNKNHSHRYTSSDSPCVFWRDQLWPFVKEVCLTCIWVSRIRPIFPTWKSTCAGAEEPAHTSELSSSPARRVTPARLPEDQRSQADGLWARTDCLRDGKLVTLAQAWCLQTVQRALQRACTHTSPWGFPGRRGESHPACPEFLYPPTLGYSRPSWTDPPYSFHCILLIFTVNAFTCDCHCCLHSV